MTAHFAAIGLVVADMGRALAFYRALGLDVAKDADDQPHVDVPLPNGARLMFDTIDTIHSFDPTWMPPTGDHRVALAFACDSPNDVDGVFANSSAPATSRIWSRGTRSGSALRKRA